MYDLTGKSIQRLELAVSNRGYNSPVKVLMAKQNDVNSRYIHAVIHDAQSEIDCVGCVIQLNSILPDGTPFVSYGEVQSNKVYVRIPKDVLSQTGRVTCDISLKGAYEEIMAGVGNSTGITGASVDKSSFEDITQEGGVYTFTFDGTNWLLDGSSVSLMNYGITYEGDAVVNDTIIVEYSNSYTLTTETFYILVNESNYEETAEPATNDTSFLDYVKSRMGTIDGEIHVIKETTGVDLYLDRLTNKIHLINSEDQLIGEGIVLPETVNGFVVESDENGNNYLYLAYNGEIVGDGVELPASGGGGGGSSYVVRVINNLGTTILNAATGQPCNLNFTIAEYYGQDQTNTKAIVAYMVRKPNANTYVTVATDNVDQGTIIKDISSFLEVGDNSVRVIVTGGESGITKSTTYTITMSEIYMTSTFNHIKPYNNIFSFPYKCFGRGLNKVVYFKVDGEIYGEPIDVGTSHNIQLSQSIDLSSYGHGSHKLEVYFEADTGATCPSLIYDVIYFVAGDTTPIIASTFNQREVTYGNDITLNYVVYTYGSDYTNLTQSIYNLQYVKCDSAEEGALLVIDNNSTPSDNEIRLADVELDNIGIGDYIKLTRINFSSADLSNVLNGTEQTWITQNYPESGTIYLELAAGATIKTFEVYVNEVDTEYELDPVSTGLVLSLNTSGRSNNDTTKSIWRTYYTSIDNNTTTIAATLDNFDYSSNGWINDESGNPALRHSGSATTTLPLPIFAASYTDDEGQNIRFAGSPSESGRTIEIEFNVHDVSDYTTEIIKCFDSERGTGLVITPRYAYLLANTMSLESDDNGNITNQASVPVVTFKDGERIRVTFVIENVGYFVDGSQNKQLVRIYINGELSKALNYSDSSLFGNNSSLIIGSEACITDIYNIRMYDTALEDSQVLQNYIADKTSVNTKLELYKDNDILNATGEIDYYKCRAKYPCILITGTLSGYKGDKTDVGIIFTKPDGNGSFSTEMDCMEKLNGKYICQSNVQGTSSQRYAKKNYKFTFKNIVNGEAQKSKYKLKGDDSIGEDTLCYKADYMSPNHPNTPNANYLSSLFTELVPPQEEDSRVQITIYGFRCLLFQRDNETDNPIFHGDGYINNDKGNTATFGLENDTDSGNISKCQKWEFLDNSEDICNFKTDRLLEPRGESISVLSALESSYPDQGDLEEAGLLPDYSHIQILYTWIYQRANYWTADKDTILDTPLEYNGNTYNTEYDYKKAIFENELALHFNKSHMLTYYLGIESLALVDNRAKNMFLTCYDVTSENIVFTDESITSLDDIIDKTTGAVDASKIDWDNSTFAIWYTSLYDLDSCLGVDNSGYCVVPYDAEWDFTLNSQKIFNGSESYLWQMVETSFKNDIANLYKQLRDENKTLSYAKMCEAHITNNADVVCPTIVNKDERYKYIDIWTEGYSKYSDDNSSQSLVKTSDYLYLVQGSKRHQITSFMYNRMNMLDSKYINASFRQDKVEMRIGLSGNTEGENVGLTLTPVTTMYCRAEYGNSGEYLGDKTEAGKSINIVPVDGNYGDILLSIYGASNLQSLGDLSKLKPYSVDVSAASKLRELILGSAEEGYSNDRLTSLDTSALALLQKIDVRNTSVANTLDLSHSPLIEEVYATGSKIAEISLPNGGYLKKLYLPDTLTTFILRDQKSIEGFEMAGTTNLQTLCIENCSDAVMLETAYLLRDSYAQLTGGIRLTGVNWNLSEWTADEVKSMLNGLISDEIKGKQMNALGSLVDDPNAYPVISGEAYIGTVVDASELTNYEEVVNAYPNMNFWSWTVTWKDRFGNVVKTEKVLNGATAHIPSEIEIQYEENGEYYEVTDWTVDYTDITADTTIAPVYTIMHTVNFLDKGGDIILSQKVVDGGSATPPENVPDYIDGENKYRHISWSGDYSVITGDTNITATYGRVWIVTWNGFDGTSTITLKTEEVLNGTAATPPENIPSYYLNEHEYKFNGWDSGYSYIAGDTTITATYLVNWTVIWEDWDGSVLKTELVPNGSPASPPALSSLSRAATPQYKYTASGWSSAYASITSDKTIVAQYTQTVQSYTAYFYSDSSFETLLYVGSGIYDGTIVYSGEELTIPEGQFFMGWKDIFNVTHSTNTIRLTEKSCYINEDGSTVDIKIYPVVGYPVIALPTEQKETFEEYTWLEAKALSNAISGGSTDAYSVTYDETEQAYTVYQNANSISSVVALNDTKDLEMTDGTIVTMRVSGFNHDIDEYGELRGISLDTLHLYSNVTKAHYSNSHAITHYKVNDVAVADNTTTYTHTQETDGNVVIESTGDTRLKSIVITDASGFVTTYYFCSSTGTNDDTHAYYQFTASNNANLGNTIAFNGLTINALKGAFRTPTSYSTYNYILMEEGCIVTIPVTAGSTVVITGYASYNLGGYKYSLLRAYLTDELYNLIPAMTRAQLVAVRKGSTLGGCAKEVEYMYDKVYALSYSEVGLGTSSPYGEEGSPYPVYTDNASRIKYTLNGAGSASRWWIRSYHPTSNDYHQYIPDTGAGASGFIAHPKSAFPVAFGFCL